MSTSLLDAYRALERKLHDLRLRTHLDDPPGADQILDEMDAVWWKLTDTERAMLDKDAPRTWPEG